MASKRSARGTRPAARRATQPRARVRIKVARLPGSEDLPLPEPATAGAAGADLSAAVDGTLVIEPGARALVPTGIAIAVPRGFEAQVRPRSGLAWRHGIVLPNAPGTIDADYRGEVKVIVLNAGSEPFSVRRGDRIAQLVVAPVVQPQWVPVTKLDDTPRGAGGFGHTGRSVTSQPASRPRRARGGSQRRPRERKT